MDARSALVIAAYDPADLFGASVVAAAVDGLAQRHEVRVLDLPALGFVPRMSPEERRAYHGEHPVVNPMVGEHAELVKAASALVFVFPTRWWQPPAVLKAWLERVLLPGVAFVFDDDQHVRPGMSHIEAISGVSSYDMSRWSVRRVGDGGRRMLLRAVRANAGSKTKTSWSALYRADRASPDARARFVAEVRAGMAKL